MIGTIKTQYKISPQQKVERKLQLGNFPNQISDGSFTPHSTIVEVGCFRTQIVKDAFERKDIASVRNDIQVLCHEMTHWFDFFGTVWGRNYIANICSGYRAMEKNEEKEFQKIIHLFDVDRSVLSPEYYRYTSEPSTEHSLAKPWSIDYVTGAEIDPSGVTREDRPIFMAKFGENPSRKNFARQPVSVGALLEVRAIASELKVVLSAISSLPDEDSRKMQMEFARREFNKISYDHNLIEYNTAAHILSVQAKTKELFLTFRLASALAYISLNLSKSDFDKLKVPDDFSVHGNRNRNFKKRQDKGYAFVAMIFNGGTYDGDDKAYIEKCTRLSNLGSPDRILDAAFEFLKYPHWFSGSSETTQHFFRETMASRHIVREHTKLSSYTLDFETLFTSLRKIAPPFVDSEGSFQEFSLGRTEEYKPKMMHDSAHKLRSYTRNLLTGCRGL